MSSSIDVEAAVRERYSEGASRRVEALCCATDYDPALLEVIPAEVLERDYGCGNPSRYVRAGETVLDLGSGSGKICFIASQIVGEAGRVIGIDINDDMLALARGAAPVVADRVGFANVEFRQARIQNLQPVVDDASVDIVVSNCVLNLVDNAQKPTLFSEIARVLRPGGRAIISDITSSSDVPADMRANPELWSGCISGALREDLFIAAFELAGLSPVKIIERTDEPWQVFNDIEFRSVTVQAHKTNDTNDGEPGGCCP